MTRLRVTFAKQDDLRWIGHLDLHTVWERTARRAGLPLSYSQGFHPQPKIQLAAALPLGFIGRAEVVDLWVDKEYDGSSRGLTELATQLQSAAPPGLRVLELAPVDERGPALQTRVQSAEYRATLLDPQPDGPLRARVEALLAAPSIPRERRGKPYDLRTLIEALTLSAPGPDGLPRLDMQLAAREGATGRPEEVLDALGIPFAEARIERCRLIFLP